MNLFLDVVIFRFLLKSFTQVTNAQPAIPTASIPTGITTAQGFVNLLGIITDWIFALLLVMAVIFIILAGLQFVTGGGNPTAVGEARRKLIYAGIGVAVALLARGFPFVVENIIGQSSVPTPKRVFATSTLHNGNFGGLGGADGICSVRASAAGLGGSWRAWLSTASVNARDRILDARYERLDGVLVASSKADLTDGSIANAISIDENGSPIVGIMVVWTGTKPDGTADPKTCVDWTGTGGLGRVGSTAGTSGIWTVGGNPGVACTLMLRLYCFEQ